MFQKGDIKMLKDSIRTICNYLLKIRYLFMSPIIGLYQNILLHRYPANTKNLIIFLTPGFDRVGGGILSISSIYEETKKLKQIHESEVILVTIPGDPVLLKYTKFANNNYIYQLPQILSYFKSLENLTINVPEYVCDVVAKNLTTKKFDKLQKIHNLYLNIMLQNIELLPDKHAVEKLSTFGKVTVTTAHEKYSNYDIRQKIGFPLHLLSTYISPEQYEFKKYNEKKDIIIVSPDQHSLKRNILTMIAKEFPQIKIQVIDNFTYEEYKKTISRAKWALTFGEGMDNYFLETIFCGGISFSVFNSKFFTDDFGKLQTVYPDYDILIEKICADMKSLDREPIYKEYQQKQYDLASKHYSYENYIKNLTLFYEKKYMYP
jgi:hypothetical protein